MPKAIDRLIVQLEEANKKLEYVLEEYAVYDDEIPTKVGEAIDALQDLNDELNAELEE